MPDPLIHWLLDVIGEHSIVGVPRVTAGKALTTQRVIEVEDSSGTHWFAKQVDRPSAWRSEVRALRTWAPALGTHAPTLRAADSALRSLLTRALPGRPPTIDDATVGHRAGALLRRLHGCQPPRTRARLRSLPAVRHLERMLALHHDLFTSQEVTYVRSQTARLPQVDPAEVVPCHGDYYVHNWLVDASGTVRMIDFGAARWDVPVEDLVELSFRGWWQRPDLAG